MTTTAAQTLYRNLTNAAYGIGPNPNTSAFGVVEARQTQAVTYTIRGDQQVPARLTVLFDGPSRDSDTIVAGFLSASEGAWKEPSVTPLNREETAVFYLNLTDGNADTEEV